MVLLCCVRKVCRSSANSRQAASVAYLLLNGLLPVSSACRTMWSVQGISLCRCCCVRRGPACVLRVPTLRQSQGCQAGVC